LTAAFTAGLLFFPIQSVAATAPGTISSVPLFLDNTALPNIFFMIDDSGSMDADLTTPVTNSMRDVGGGEGLMPVESASNSSAYYGYMYATYATDNVYTYGGTWGGVAPAQESVDTASETDAYQALTGVWRARSKDYNKTYYDPSVTYEPWSGTDSSGSAYADATYTSIYSNPYTKTLEGSSYRNLSANHTVTTRVPDVSGGGQDNFTFTYMPMRYYEWTDTNGNGDVDATDAHVLITIVSGKSECSTGTPGSNANSCLVRDFVDEAKNFANWWQYHRRREYAMKASVADVIAGTNSVRMGISTLQANDSGETRQIEEMNNDVASGNKKSLMNSVYSIHSSGGTDLHEALDDSGRYYVCSGNDPFGFAEDCPIEMSGSYPAGRCQQNFTILFTDGYYTGTISGINNADNDGSTWSEGSVTYKFDDGTVATGPYGDGASNSLADVAMHYYERDLISNFANMVPTSCGVDENPGQHMVTYTVGFGVEGNLSESDLPSSPRHSIYDYAPDPKNTCTAAPTTTTPSWPANPAAGNQSKIDDLVHAAYNGRGMYFASNNSTTLTANLKQAIDDVFLRTGSAAAVAFNSTTLGTDTHAYLALFDSSRWSGDLVSYPLNPDTGKIINTADWKAATKLDSATPASRVILTNNGTDGIPFNWTAVSALAGTDIIRTDLGYNSGVEQKRLNYIRGDRTEEGTGENYRERTNRMGDIVHSTPIFVGAPGVGWPDTAPFPAADGHRYSDFKADQLALPRTEMVYVGANDGMLHGFRASDGVELLGYIPRVLFSDSPSAGLHYLTDPTYGHRYYVDMTPAISDAYVKTTAGGSAAWHTIIVGALGAGGMGLYALDVTNPANFTEGSTNPADVVMWEFTSSDDSDLGYTYSEPVIALMNDGRWAAIFGNGYNSANGIAKLFIVYLDGGLDGVWTLTTDYRVISTAEGDSTNKNGLSSPAVIDTDGNGTADRVYAGDLKGKMWVFNLSASNGDSWDVDGGTPIPLFTGNSDQPITTAPLVADHPTESTSGSNQPNLMVYFGTGQYLTGSDISSTTIQSYYGVWDNGGTKALARTNLVEQELDSTITPNGATYRVLTANPVDYTSGSHDYGWFIDLDMGDTGERVVVNSTLRGDHIFFNTIVPSPDPCAAGGWGWFMAVSAETGGKPDKEVFDFNNDGVVDSDDLLGGDAYSGTKHEQGMPSESSFLGDKQYTTDTRTEDADDVEERAIETLAIPEAGRMSWEELMLLN